MSSIWRKRCGSQAAISSGQRVAVARRPALEDVRDEDVRARQADARRAACRGACPPARRTARPAGPRGSRAPRRRTSGRRRAPRAEDDLRAALRERAARAARRLLGVRSKCGGALDGVHRTASLRALPGCDSAVGQWPQPQEPPQQPPPPPEGPLNAGFDAAPWTAKLESCLSTFAAPHSGQVTA